MGKLGGDGGGSLDVAFAGLLCLQTLECFLFFICYCVLLDWDCNIRLEDSLLVFAFLAHNKVCFA